MPELKTLSGKEIIGILLSFGFEMVSQRGSHVKLRRITLDGAKQTLTIPNHRELDKGTCRAIYRQALRYIPENELKPHFYFE
ncbi:MAG: type II toxin-antitoxin system HicA family toxin [Candidatus Brennerbacteria bacterium]|nr:type II toxin-antitoxin system HicA family toxin [Candidatus Brennerbacteria bacterium]